MSVEVVVILVAVVVSFAVAVWSLAKALGKNAETLREVVADQNRIIEDANSQFVRLCTEAGDKAHAFSEEYREMYHLKVEAAKEREDHDLMKLSEDEKAIIAHYRNNRQMESALVNPPPNPADALLNPQ